MNSQWDIDVWAAFFWSTLLFELPLNYLHMLLVVALERLLACKSRTAHTLALFFSAFSLFKQLNAKSKLPGFSLRLWTGNSNMLASALTETRILWHVNTDSRFKYQICLHECVVDLMHGCLHPLKANSGVSRHDSSSADTKKGLVLAVADYLFWQEKNNKKSISFVVIHTMWRCIYWETFTSCVQEHGN